VEFPDRLHLRGASVVVKVFKGHPQDIHWQGEWQFTAMLRVQHAFMFRQLGLSILASAAKFSVHRRFHDDPGSALVRGHRNLEVHIAVGGIDTRFL